MFNVNGYFNCMLLLIKLGEYFGPENIWTLGKMIVIDHVLNYAIACNLIWNVFVWHKAYICFSTGAPEYPGVPHISSRPDNHACIPSRALQPNEDIIATAAVDPLWLLTVQTLDTDQRITWTLLRCLPFSHDVSHSLSQCLPFSLKMSAILSRDVCHSLSRCLPFSLVMSAIL